MKNQLATRSREGGPALAARARQTLIYTQAVFFCALAVCLVIKHGHVAETDGISFYGVYPPTMPALFTGYLVGAAGLWWTSGQFVAAGAPRWTLVAMRVIATGLVVLLATPYNPGTFLNWAHMSVGVTMGVAQVALVVDLLRRRRNPGLVTGACVGLFGGVLGAISLPDWHITLLLEGETLLEVGFAWCLIEWTHGLER
ncbi:MAG: hypothetical protein ACRDV0_06680 [Acidimicrobiales bacterium]